MSEPTFEHLRAILHEHEPEMGPIVDDLINDLATHLGESPEAWRGAMEVADHLVQIIGTTMRQVGDTDIQRSFAVVTLLMAILTQISMHPLTPYGQEHR